MFFYGKEFAVKMRKATDETELEYSLREVNSGTRVNESVSASNLLPMISCCSNKVLDTKGQVEYIEFYLQFPLFEY